MNKADAAKILGVPEDSTDEVLLKTAFRAKCHETHPDVGGTEQQFQQLQIAYKTMTGETEPEPSKGLDLFMGIFLTIVQQVTNPAVQDPIYAVVIELQKRRTAALAKITECKATVTRTQNILDRLTCKGTDNPIAVLLNKTIVGAPGYIKLVQEEITNIDTAFEVAGRYDYRLDPAMPAMYTTTSTWG